MGKGGRIVYRIGQAIALNASESAPMRVTDSFHSSSYAAQQNHGQSFQRLTDIVMNRINDLLDPEYQRDESASGKTEINRFL